MRLPSPQRLQAHIEQLIARYGGDAYLMAGGVVAEGELPSIDDGDTLPLHGESRKPAFVEKDDEGWVSLKKSGSV